MPSRRELMLAAPAAALTGLASSALAADAPAAIFDAGPHRVGRDLTLSGTVTIRPGARLVIASGATLTLSGDLDAPGEQIFSGSGTVNLSRSRVVAARPEWWGARPDDPLADCVPALAACLRAHPAMQLGLGDYYLAGTWTVDRPNRRIWGIGRTSDARGTRLVLREGPGPVMTVGGERPPATINEYLRGIDLRWIELARAHPAPPPTPSPAGDDAGAATGLAVRHVLDCVFEGLRANEHAIGYSIRGAVRSYFRDCTAFRSVFPLPARDVFVGFDMDGRAPPIATGANASVYLIDCNARTGNRPVLPVSVGCRLSGALSDTFLIRFETTEVGTGILVDGRAPGLADADHRFRHVDLHIDTPVLDQCFDVGLAVSDLSDRAMVDIAAPYVALAKGGTAALSIARCGGTIGVVGGQLIGSLAPGGVGILLDRTTGVGVAGTKLMGFRRPVDAHASSGFDLVVAINAADAPAGSAAIQFAHCATGYCRPRISGPAGSYASGVALDADSHGITVEVAAIDVGTVGQSVTVAGRARPPTLGSTVVVPAPSLG